MFAPSINKCFFSGNVGNDPETRRTGSGKTISKISIAVARPDTRNPDGTFTPQKPIWVNVTAWDKDADTIHNNIQKGSFLTVECSFAWNTYKNKDNIEVTAPQFTVQNIFGMSNTKKVRRDEGQYAGGGYQDQGQGGQPPDTNDEAPPQGEEPPMP